MRHVCALVAAVMLACAMAHLPIGYYSLLRIVVTSVALWITLYEAAKEYKNVSMVFLLVAAVFNPILPIYMSKGEWTPIDVAACVAFLLYALGGFFPQWKTR